MRVLIYRLDIHNLQTKTVSFPDQQKILKEVVFSLAVSMNANTKNSQIKYCHTKNTLKSETFAKQGFAYLLFLGKFAKVWKRVMLDLVALARCNSRTKMFSSSVTKVFSREQYFYSPRANCQICFD